MKKKKSSKTSGNKVMDILSKIGGFFVFLKDKIVDFFCFLKDKIADLWEKLFGNSDIRFGIRYKILLGFVIPLIFILVVGIASYSKAKQGMRDRYEKSTLEAVRMISAQMNMLSDFMKSEGAQYASNQELSKLTTGAYNNSLYEKTKVSQSINYDVQATQIANSLISNIFIITKKDLKNISTKSSIIDGFFEEYYDSLEKIDQRGNVAKWIDSHPIIDEKMNLNDEEDTYLFSYQQLQSSTYSMVVIDASEQNIRSFLEGVDLGDGSILGFVTMNGREVITRNGDILVNDGRTVFAGRDYYKDMIDSGNSDGIAEIEYCGEGCILFYSACTDNGCAVAAIVPLSTVTAEASSIWRLTIILVLIAFLVVFGIAFLISNNIQKNVKKVSLSLGEVAQGNLNVKVKVNGKDEFNDLAGAATEMIANTKKLVSKVDDAAEELAGSARNVQTASNMLSSKSDDILRAVAEMSDGMERQKQFADQCVDTTDRLSDEIGNVSIQIGKIKDIIEETNVMIKDSVKLVGILGEKAKDTTDATDSVKNSVSALLDETNKINKFVTVIKNISSQTHLLSLNASIEAARAGEAGRGFSVVAEEIRGLASESAKSAGEIMKLVDGINVQTDISAVSVDKARSIADEQFGLVNRSVEVFDRMKASMDSLIAELENIDIATEAANARKDEAVNAVGDISEIINESVANAESVKNILRQLKVNIDNLDKTASKLGVSMDELKTEVDVFRI